MLETLSFGIKKKAGELNKTGICLKLELTTASFLNLYLSIKTQLPVYFWTEYMEWQPVYQVKRLILIDNIPSETKYINTWLLDQSEKKNLLLISNRDYAERNYVRNYHRSEIVDYFPLFKSSLGDVWPALKWSEIVELYNKIDIKQFPEFETYLKSFPKPNDKAYNTDITYTEYEWLMDIEKLYDYNPIIKSDNDPTKHQKWFTFNIRQKEIIAQLHQIEKNTRYKETNK